MGSINVLILSVGRRVELVNDFKLASKELKIDSKIITADMSENAPAVYFGDKKYMLPRVDAGNYIEELIKICIEENIKLIVPTIDTELITLAENKEKIESKTNAKVLISDLEVIEICRNKKRTTSFLENNGFGIPKQITQEDIEKETYKFPLFIKPADGSSSINAFKIRNQNELIFYSKGIRNPIIQEFVEGEEYSIDAFLDFESNPITIVPRKRLATRGGEISKGLIDKDELIINEIKKLLKRLNPIGQVTIQCMKTKDGIRFIEINPRFGGGAPMSIKAGANSPLNLYKLLMGEKLDYNEDYSDKLLALRFDDAVYVNEKGELL